MVSEVILIIYKGDWLFTKQTPSKHRHTELQTGVDLFEFLGMLGSVSLGGFGSLFAFRETENIGYNIAKLCVPTARLHSQRDLDMGLRFNVWIILRVFAQALLLQVSLGKSESQMKTDLVNSEVLKLDFPLPYIFPNGGQVLVNVVDHVLWCVPGKYLPQNVPLGL